MTWKDKTAKISDLGSIKIEENQRSTTIISGSPFYCAPEIFLEKRIGTFNDIYSLGLIFVEVFVGKEYAEKDEKGKLS